MFALFEVKFEINPFDPYLTPFIAFLQWLWGFNFEVIYLSQNLTLSIFGQVFDPSY